MNSRHVAEGPRWYRSRIRTLGPFVALLPPAVLGLASAILVQLDKTWAGYLGLIACVSAAPGLLGVGVPFASSSQWPIGIAISVVFWLLVGSAAARWATRHPLATWTEYWRAYAWLTVAVWVGAVVAVIIAVWQVGGLV